MEVDWSKFENLDWNHVFWRLPDAVDGNYLLSAIPDAWRPIRMALAIDGRMNAEISDTELLFRFRRFRDEEAFADLVSRYSALVMGVCRRAL